MFKAGSCIGCGVCAYKCPTKSILLEQRGKTTDP
ncbi:MAG: 4Fe-4S binding protein, partial [Deltaproteobacteria bacterium]|nr:4Fe-4S binding protein [Deltaproteobacteria bacterium]